MRRKLTLLIISLSVFIITASPADARRHRRACCCCPCTSVLTTTLPTSTKLPRVRTYLEGPTAHDDDENALPPHVLDALRTKALLRFNVRIPDDDLFAGTHRAVPKTTVVHGGDTKAFNTVGELIRYFESPTRKQERWWGTVIKQSTNERNDEIELVNVSVNDAWIYEISHQADNDYHLLIGIRPDRDQGRYVNAEISGIDPDSPDASHLLTVRKFFKQQYEESTGKPFPAGYTQPRDPIHIRVSGSIFLDADHDREEVGHGDIKNFTSWEIHPINEIEILDN